MAAPLRTLSLVFACCLLPSTTDARVELQMAHFYGDPTLNRVASPEYGAQRRNCARRCLESDDCSGFVVASSGDCLLQSDQDPGATGTRLIREDELVPGEEATFSFDGLDGDANLTDFGDQANLTVGSDNYTMVDIAGIPPHPSSALTTIYKGCHEMKITAAFTHAGKYFFVNSPDPDKQRTYAFNQWDDIWKSVKPPANWDQIKKLADKDKPFDGNANLKAALSDLRDVLTRPLSPGNERLYFIIGANSICALNGMPCSDEAKSVPWTQRWTATGIEPRAMFEGNRLNANEVFIIATDSKLYRWSALTINYDKANHAFYSYSDVEANGLLGAVLYGKRSDITAAFNLPGYPGWTAFFTGAADSYQLYYWNMLTKQVIAVGKPRFCDH